MGALQALGLLLLGAALGRAAMALRAPVSNFLARRRRLADLGTTAPADSGVAPLRESRALPPAGRAGRAWVGWREFVVVGREPASDDGAASLLLAPGDGQRLPPFRPGQYLTLALEPEAAERPVIRCFSLSRPADPESYEITVRRPDDERGGGSAAAFLVEELAVGARLRSQAPRGSFVLDPHASTPLVLIAGGTGIAPIACMLEAVANADLDRDVYLFSAAADGRRHVLRDRVARAQELYPRLCSEVFYSRPGPADVRGRDYDHAARLTLAHIQRSVSSLTWAEFYICAPPSMLGDLSRDLRAAGVPEAQLHFDCWGPESVRSARPLTPEPVGIDVTFQRSGKTCRWDPRSTSLLEFAEDNGVPLASGCRAGNCGACVTVTQGDVRYIRDPEDLPEPGTCLACIAVPAGPLVIDA